jgi:serine/threonine protein kinase
MRLFETIYHANNASIAYQFPFFTGGFSFVYLVKDITEGREFATTASSQNASEGSNAANGSKNPELLCLKITSIHSRQQRDIAEKEAKLLSRLSHPSIIKMMDACYRSAPAPSGGGVMAGIVGRNNNQETSTSKSIPTGAFPQHLILMEYCEGGHALDVCNGMHAAGNRFDLPSLIIAFGQICNAVSYLHAQRPPIVHRDLKPVNFLVKNGAYKLCDFGSAVFGHVELKTSQKRQEAQEVIEKTTTQMFRAPEMVDLYMAKKLTQSTDVWALGCCLYSLAYFQNCFEEGSNLAILSRNYKIPDDNPYGPGLAELIDRMLTTDYKARCDMTEVILCLSALYSGNELPPRKERSSSKKTEGKKEANKVGTYRTDGQGIRTTPIIEPKKKISEVSHYNLTVAVCFITQFVSAVVVG